MQGVSDFTIKDEAFFNMTWSESPKIQVLATAVMAKTQSAGTHAGEVVPQIWIYERNLGVAPAAQPFRAFVWMQGHNYVNFSHPQIQPMLLRGIAWAGRYPADALATERPQGRGRGGRGRGGDGA
jgi:type 1 glutamine amidotransferase